MATLITSVNHSVIRVGSASHNLSVTGDDENDNVRRVSVVPSGADSDGRAGFSELLHTASQPQRDASRHDQQHVD